MGTDVQTTRAKLPAVIVGRPRGSMVSVSNLES